MVKFLVHVLCIQARSLQTVGSLGGECSKYVPAFNFSDYS